MALDYIYILYYVLTVFIAINIWMDTLATYGFMLLISKERDKHLQATNKIYKNEELPLSCGMEHQNTERPNIENEVETIDTEINQVQVQPAKKAIIGFSISLVACICDLACSILLAYGLFNGNMNIIAVWLWIFPVVSLIDVAALWGIIYLHCFTKENMNKDACHRQCCLNIFNIIFFALVLTYYFLQT